MRGNGVPAWTAALDELEQFLAALQESLAPGDGADSVRSVPALPLPSHLGPIPVDVQGRAAAVLERCRAFEADLQAGMATAGREVSLLDRMRSEQQPPRAVYVDQGL